LSSHFFLFIFSNFFINFVFQNQSLINSINIKKFSLAPMKNVEVWIFQVFTKFSNRFFYNLRRFLMLNIPKNHFVLISIYISCQVKFFIFIEGHKHYFVILYALAFVLHEDCDFLKHLF
jgi:hypothetical protein